ncbi:MAG: OmpA family protein [Ilumatobacter sp.]
MTSPITGARGTSSQRTALTVVAVIVAFLLAMGLGIWIGSSDSGPDSLLSTESTLVETTVAAPEVTTTAAAADDAATEADGPAAASSPATTVAPEPEAAAPETTVAPATTVAPETTVAPATTVAPETTVAPPTTVAGHEVPESRAIVRQGQIFLEGAIPDEETGREIEELAAAVLGPDNVINNYIVDPAASDPNLGNITVEDTINFESGESEILPESEGLLNQGLLLFNLRPAMTITIVGHTDSVGTEEDNLALSGERAGAVRAWFIDRDVDPDRIDVFAAGEGSPIADNDTVQGRLLNRRIEFILVNVLAEA